MVLSHALEVYITGMKDELVNDSTYGDMIHLMAYDDTNNRVLYIKQSFLSSPNGFVFVV